MARFKTTSPIQTVTLDYADDCSHCGMPLHAGDTITLVCDWYVYCSDYCAGHYDPSPVDPDHTSYPLGY